MVDTLMERLDALDHNERLSALVSHLRSQETSAASDLRKALAAGDVHRRRLSLFVAQFLGDLNPALDALRDASISVRHMAAHMVGRHAESISESYLEILDVCTFRKILRQLGRRNCPAIAEPLVTTLCACNRLLDAALALPACSSQFIAERLRDVGWLSDVFSKNLIRRHSKVVVEFMEDEFDESKEQPDRVWKYYSNVWIELAKRQPDLVFDLIERFGDVVQVRHQIWDILVALSSRSPIRAMKLMRISLEAWPYFTIPSKLARRARSIDSETIMEFCKMLFSRKAFSQFADLVTFLPYPRREALFEAAIAPLTTDYIEWPGTVLGVLPHHLRDREAARMLGLKIARERPEQRRNLLGFRLINSVRLSLEQECKSSVASDRSEAYSALIMSTGRSRSGMPETLAFLKRIRNEQDPVRKAVLEALARVPAILFDDRDALDGVLSPIFDARDTSEGTRVAAANIAKRLLIANASVPSSPMLGLAADIITRLAGQSGLHSLPSLVEGLRRGEEQAIVDALLPWLEGQAKRGCDDSIYSLWESLGKRARNIESLGNVMEHLVWKGKKSEVGTAVEYWISDRRNRQERVRVLLEKDPSAIYENAVFMYCDRWRQTLLKNRFSLSPIQGRFNDSKTLVVPDVHFDFHRWPPEIQKEFLTFLDHAEKTPELTSSERTLLIATRALVPLTNVEDFKAALDSDDANIVDAALAAIVWTDRPASALPILLNHVDGDRALAAIYSMPHLAHVLPVHMVVDSLAALLERSHLKITVHKQVLRLLSCYPTQKALNILFEAFARPSHRDVRIAAMHSARSLLNESRAWDFLRRSADDESLDVLRAFAAVPVTSIPAMYKRRYFELMLRLGDNADKMARWHLINALQGGWIAENVDASVDYAFRLLGDRGASHHWVVGPNLLVACARSASTHSRILAFIQTLLDEIEKDIAPAEEDQLPYRQLLQLIDALARNRPVPFPEFVESMAELLLSHPITWAAGAFAKMVATSNENFASVVLQLLEIAPSPGSRSVIAMAARDVAGHYDRKWTETQALATVDNFISGDAAARLVAVRIIMRFGSQWTWNSLWTNRVSRLRQDEDLDVRVAARMVCSSQNSRRFYGMHSWTGCL